MDDAKDTGTTSTPLLDLPTLMPTHAPSLFEVVFSESIAGGDSKEFEAGSQHGPGKLSPAVAAHQKVVSSLIMMFTIVFLALFYGVHHIPSHTYQLLNTIFAIISGLLIVGMQRLIWNRVLTRALGVSLEFTNNTELVFFLLWYPLISVVALRMHEDHLGQLVWVEGIITHATAFTVIEYVCQPQALYAISFAKAHPGSAFWMTLYYLCWVLGVLFLFGVSGLVSQCLRKPFLQSSPNEGSHEQQNYTLGADHAEEPHWVHVAQESETEACAIATGFVCMHFVWSLYDPGVAHPYDAALPYKATPAQCFAAIATMFAGMVGLVPFAKFVKRRNSKLLEKVELHLAMAIGWVGYLAMKFWRNSHRATEYISVISRKVLAAWGWVLLMTLGLLFLSFLSRRGKIDMRDYTQTIRAAFLVCGVFAEKIYGHAISITGHAWSVTMFTHVFGKSTPNPYLIDIVTILGECFMILILLPAWTSHIAPRVLAMHAHHEHKNGAEHHADEGAEDQHGAEHHGAEDHQGAEHHDAAEGANTG